MKKILLNIRFFLLSLLLLVGVFVFRLSAQDSQPVQIQFAPIQEPTDSITRNQLDPFQGNVRSRLGMRSLDMLSSEFENRSPRISSGAVFGRGNRPLGIDRNAPGSRFKPLPPLPDSAAPAVESAEQTPFVQRPPVSSANTVAPAARGSYSPEPIQRPAGYFDQANTPTDMIEAPSLVEPENIIRTPIEQRWFRDFGNSRGASDNSNLGGIGRRPEPMEGQAPESGQAVSVGGPGMLQENRQRQAAESNFRVDPRQQAFENQQAALAQQATNLRTFEQQLEAKLLGDPSVHLLSPVQVSFKNGIATVRGVVPSQQHKVAAGTLLLTDPAVKQVNNLMTTVPADPAQIPAPIEPKD